MFTSVDYDKFRALRITQVALQLEELFKDDGNDRKTPEELFLTAVDEALELRRSNRIEKLISRARFPIPQASIEEIRYLPERGVSSVRMQRYATHDWGADPMNIGFCGLHLWRGSAPPPSNATGMVEHHLWCV